MENFSPINTVLMETYLYTICDTTYVYFNKNNNEV
jgi:hypothetical protein